METEMKKTLGAIAITAIALATTAAFAETNAEEQRARLEKLWQNDTTAVRTAAEPRKNFAGISSVLRQETTGGWAGNFRGGRIHPPAGR